MPVEQALISEPCKIAVQRTAVWNWPKMGANFVRLKKASIYRVSLRLVISSLKSLSNVEVSKVLSGAIPDG